VLSPLSYALTTRSRKSKEYACIRVIYQFAFSRSIVKPAIKEI
jgi:hypothetical protein